MRKYLTLLIGLLLITGQFVYADKNKHTFRFGNGEFLLDEKPFQIISGELHPARIPVEYWKHRIQMAKAMGCNTISAYIFWNYHEEKEGEFDFTNGNHNIAQFLKLVQDEGMWVILRPGPYVCAEWELGGIPPYLLRTPDIKLRTLDPRYMAAAQRYMSKLAAEITPLLITKGGPVLMLQIENEYGSFGTDKNYISAIKDYWKTLGIDVPTFTGDGPATKMLEAGTLPGSAVGLDSGSSDEDFNLAAKINPGVPVFSSETYPGWLTHWGESWARPDTAQLYKEVRYLMDNKKSFNLYVLHGGTNFGYTSGANSGGKGYEPDITSYDYDAPVDEQGLPTHKYEVLRKIIGSYLPKGKKLPPVPEPIRVIELSPVGMQPFTAIWDNLPQPVITEKTKTFEECGQDYGIIIYRTELAQATGGTLTVNDVHDFATVLFEGNYVGYLDRREAKFSIELPQPKTEHPVLEIVVEAMGRINYGRNMEDRKGITEKVTLNGNTLLNWKLYNLILDRKYIFDLRSSGKSIKKPGIFFKGNFVLTRAEGNVGADTYIDMSKYTKGIVWVNGHNLGRYWNIGPQKRLFCPAAWMHEGLNEIMILDLIQTDSPWLQGFKTAE